VLQIVVTRSGVGLAYWAAGAELTMCASRCGTGVSPLHGLQVLPTKIQPSPCTCTSNLAEFGPQDVIHMDCEAAVKAKACHYSIECSNLLLFSGEGSLSSLSEAYAWEGIACSRNLSGQLNQCLGDIRW